MINSFKELVVYQKAFDISIEIHKYSQTLPKSEQFAIADQIRRASKSICANLAEGFGRQRKSSVEFKRYILMAIGSCNEMLVWIDYCIALDYTNNIDLQKCSEEYFIILKMLNSLYSKVQK